MTDSTEFINLLKLKRGELIAVTGSGGKTSAMFQIAKEYENRGEPIIVTTSTKIGFPQYDFCSRVVEADLFLPEKEPLFPFPCVAGSIDTASGKITGPSPAYIRDVLWRNGEHTVIYEADGSKNLPLKLYSLWEPVLTGSDTHIIIIISIAPVGKSVKGNLHRLELMAELADKKTDIDFLEYLLIKKDGYLDKAQGKKRTLVINSVNSEQDYNNAKLLADKIKFYLSSTDTGIILRGSFFGCKGYFYGACHAY